MMTEKEDAHVASRTQQEEVDRNHETFKTMLPELMRTDAGRFSLMHGREVVACFDTGRDTLLAGQKLFEGRPFSIQKTTGQAVDLGYFSHVGVLRTV